MNASRPFGALDYDQSGDPNSWHIGSVALLLVTTGIYWASCWVASGFLPLAALASGRGSQSEKR
jgi:hypothetical protein